MKLSNNASTKTNTSRNYVKQRFIYQKYIILITSGPLFLVGFTVMIKKTRRGRGVDPVQIMSF